MADYTQDTAQSTSQPRQPPLQVETCIHLAWALTLNLSDEQRQVDMGYIVNRVWEGLPSYLTPTTVQGLNHEDTLFFYELFAVLAAFVRSIGFERDVYARYLNIQEQKRQRRTEYWEDLASMTSFSSESILFRISAFLGVGSLADILVNFKEINLTLILFWGMIGLFSTSIVLKVIRYFKDRQLLTSAWSQQRNYWQRVARPNFIRILKHLNSDISCITMRRYPGYSEPIMTDEKHLQKVIDELLPAENVYDLS